MGQLKIDLSDIGSAKGKVSVVTGGAKGIGRAIVNLLIQTDAIVWACDLKPPEEPFPNGVIFKSVDVLKWKELLKFIEEPVRKHGRLDYVFANAGLVSPDLMATDTYDDSGQLVEPSYLALRTNLLAMMNTVKLGIHYMRSQDMGGAIICTSSKAGYSPLGNPEYAASKHGVIGMIRALRDELIPLKIRINAIAPGFTDTHMIPLLISQQLRRKGVNIQAPETVALAAVYLATQYSFHGKCIQVINGQFRELEDEYTAAAEQIFGDVNEGREVPRDHLVGLFDQKVS